MKKLQKITLYDVEEMNQQELLNVEGGGYGSASQEGFEKFKAFLHMVAGYMPQLSFMGYVADNMTFGYYSDLARRASYATVKEYAQGSLTPLGLLAAARAYEATHY